ncbi:MAG TPA: TRAP transporter TatT component family protein [Methylomirabilota bacterium]|nr:TRAP transporter TatT component family protein [Methylomirabilota bacterium]
MNLLPLTLLALLVALPASAESPLERAKALYTNYHEDLNHLDTARDLLEQMLKSDPQVQAMVLLSHVYFTWGDVRAKTDEEKLQAYERGRDVAKRGVELAPRDPEAHFWYAVNLGRWSQTKGVLRSLFNVPTMEQEIKLLLELAPTHPGTHNLAGNLYYTLPGLFGGDMAKAERHFKKALESDPHFTGARVDLARFLITKKNYAEARQELRKVLEEKSPRTYADWVVKDTKRARELIESIKDKKD